MNILQQIISNLLTEEQVLGYTIPSTRTRCLIRQNKKAKSKNDAWEIQLVRGSNKWWRFSSEDECCEFAIGLAGAGGDDYPIYVIRGDEVVHLTFPKDDLITYGVSAAREKERKEIERQLRPSEYPEHNEPPKSISWDEIPTMAKRLKDERNEYYRRLGITISLANN